MAAFLAPRHGSWNRRGSDRYNRFFAVRLSEKGRCGPSRYRGKGESACDLTEILAAQIRKVGFGLTFKSY